MRFPWVGLQRVKHEGASQRYSETGSRILELAKTACKSFVSQNSAEQRKLLETLLSNCDFRNYLVHDAV